MRRSPTRRGCTYGGVETWFTPRRAGRPLLLLRPAAALSSNGVMSQGYWVPALHQSMRDGSNVGPAAYADEK